jgi:DNA-directed RNA polymerase subunit RPC12/RpoP
MLWFKRYECEHCKKRFSKVEELMQHIQVIHYANSKYYCSECDMYFDNGNELRMHAFKYHTYKVRDGSSSNNNNNKSNNK